MSRNLYFLVESILQSTNAAKQDYGRRFAYLLGMQPGPRGADDGVDGSTMWNGIKVHFQSKLRSERLDVDDAKIYFADILHHKAQVSIILSGIGFKDTFTERLASYGELKGIDLHLLSLPDVLENSQAFQNACLSLPPLRRLEKGCID